MQANELKEKYGIEPDTGEDMTPHFQAFIDTEEEPYLELAPGEYVFKGTIVLPENNDNKVYQGFLSIEGTGAIIKIESDLWLLSKGFVCVNDRGFNTVTLRDLEFTGSGATVVESKNVVNIKWCKFHDLKTIAKISNGGCHTFKHLTINNVDTAFEIRDMAQFIMFDRIEADGMKHFATLTARTPASTGIMFFRCHIKNSTDWALDISQGGGDTTYVSDCNFEDCKGGVKLCTSLFDKLYSTSFERCETGVEWMGCVHGGHISYSFFEDCKTAVRFIGSGECSLGDCIFQKNELDVQITSCRRLMFNNNIFGENSFSWSGSNGRCRAWDNSFKKNEPKWPPLFEHDNNFENVEYVMRQTTFTEVDPPRVEIKRLGAGVFAEVEGNEFDGAGQGITVIKDKVFKGDNLIFRNLTLINCQIVANGLEIKDCVINAGNKDAIKARGDLNIDGLYMVNVNKGFILKNCSGTLRNVLCVGNPDYFIEADDCSEMDIEAFVSATERKDVKLNKCKYLRFNVGGLDGFTDHKFEMNECENIDIRNIFMSSASTTALQIKSCINIVLEDSDLNWAQEVFEGLAKVSRLEVYRCGEARNLLGGWVYEEGKAIDCKKTFTVEENKEEWTGDDEEWEYYHFKGQDGPVTLKYNSGWREGNKIKVADCNWFANLIMLSKEPVSGRLKIKVTRPTTRYGWEESKLHGAVLGWSDEKEPKVMYRIEDTWEGNVDGYLTLGACAYGAVGVEVEWEWV